MSVQVHRTNQDVLPLEILHTNESYQNPLHLADHRYAFYTTNGILLNKSTQREETHRLFAALQELLVHLAHRPKQLGMALDDLLTHLHKTYTTKAHTPPHANLPAINPLATK